ncbi:MAG: thioredoxin family protein [Candidatus Lokiarchaeia archaeon]
MHIVVIGPHPPCIRCRRISKLFKEIKREENGDIKLSHVTVGSEEAQKYGKIIDSHIFLDSIGVDAEELDKLFEKRDFKGIDEWLTPYREKAKEKGIMLTPAIVINDKVKTFGVVPEKQELKKIVREEMEAE